MKFIASSIFKTFILSLLIIAQVHFAYAQTASILPPAKTTFVDLNAKPLTAGTVDFYIPGTTTRKTTWQDAAETVPNANPVTLDAAGRALILGSGAYRQVVKDKLGNVIWDQVTSSTGSASGGGTTSTGDGDLVGTIKPWAGMSAPNQYMFTYGQELSRATFAALFTAITSAQPVFCTSGSPILNGLGDTSNFWIGSAVEIACLAAGNSTVISKTATTVTLAANANVTTTTIATFLPWGRGNGSGTTFNLPDFRGFVIAGNNIMGGTSSSQLTTTFFGVQDPNSSGASGGSQSKVILLSNQVPYTPSGSVGASFNVANVFANGNVSGSSIVNSLANGNNGNTNGAQTIPLSLAPTFTGTAQGGGQGSAASAVIAAGGSSYTTGTQLITVSGGVCTTQPQFNVTVTAGAITVPVLANSGLCSVAPTNPAATTGGGGTGGTLTVTYGQAPLSVIQPTKTANYIIKVTPDQNSATASGVTSLGLMTGDISCGAGLSCTGNTVSVTGGGAGGITIGTTAISSGTSTRILFDNAGVVGEYSITGTGNVVLSASPTLTGTVTIPVLALGTALSLSNGGTNNSLTASNGGLVYSDGSKLQILPGTVTAGQCALSGSNAAPTWGSCAGGAAVSSITNSDGTLTISPTTGAAVASLALGHTNTWTAPQTIQSSSANAFAVGLNGATNPAFSVDASTASQQAGLKITGAVTGGTVALAPTDINSNTGLSINAKGAGTIQIGNISLGSVTITPALTLSAALTYGGVALSNAVTGTGNMVLSANPTITGSFTATGLVTYADMASTAIATAAQYMAGTASELVQAGTLYQAETTTTFGATTTFDFSTFINTNVTLTANITTQTLTNVTVGKAGTIAFTQSGAGSFTTVWNSIFKFAGGVAPTLTTGSTTAVDILSYSCRSATFCVASLIKDVR